MKTEITKNRYERIKNKDNYDSLLSSGMFWEFYPELTGIWEEDNKIIHDCDHPLHNRQKGGRCGSCGEFLPTN